MSREIDMSEPARSSLRMPFSELLGLVITKQEKDNLTAKMLVRPELCTAGQLVHGGALMAFADSVGALATLINLPEGARGTTTIESKTNFVRGAREGETIVSSTTPIHIGRRTQVWQTRLETEDGKLVAIVTQTQLVL
jgi:1,4-dihydroxy-2-naphthoyl-CoA hydrolase